MRALRGLITSGVNNAVFANLLMICMLVGGFTAAGRMIRETYPEFTLNRVLVDVVYPGAGPEDVERAVNTRIEQAIQGIDGIKSYQSFATENLGRLWIELLDDIDDPTPVMLEIKDRVEQITSLPKEAEKPVIREQVYRTQVINVAVYGDMSEQTLDHVAREVRDELLSNRRITLVNLWGVRDHEIIIEISEEALRQFGLTFERVMAEVARNTGDLPAGTLRTRDEEITLRTIGQRYTARDFEDLVLIARPDGTVVRLHQVAKVRDGFEESTRLGRFNGSRAAMISVFKTETQDATELARLVREYVGAKQSTLSESVNLAVWADMSQQVNDRISMLVKNGLGGIFLIFITLTLFLNMRISLYVALGVPVSFGGAFLVMYLLGETVNMISLLGLITVSGMIVDDAIVIAERADVRRMRGEPARAAARDGTNDVALPVLASAVTTMIAFAPLLYVSGVMGKLIAILPVVVIVALAASLAEAFVVLPSHLVHAGAAPSPRSWHGRVRGAVDRGQEWFIRRIYRPVFHAALDNRAVTASLSFAAMIVLIGLIAGGRAPLILLPEIDGNMLRTRVRFPEGTPAETTLTALRQLEQAAAGLNKDSALRHGGSGDLVRNTFSMLGVQQGYVAEYGSHLGEVSIELMPAEQRRLDCGRIVDRWRRHIGDIPGAVVTLDQVAEGPQEKPLEIRLFGDDLERLDAAAEALKHRLQQFEGVYDIDDTLNPGKRELHIQLKPAARSLGLTIEDLARQVRAGFFGGEALRIQRGRDEVTVRVRYPDDERASINDIERMRVRTPTREEVPFREVADVRVTRSYALISHQFGERRTRVLANVDTQITNAEEIIRTLQADFLPQLEQKFGVRSSPEGQHALMWESIRSLVIGFLLALIGIYAILGGMLRSYWQPLIIMTAIPMGFIGAAVGHWVMGYQITMFSLFGVVALAGVVVNDSIVLIDQINNACREGTPVLQAVRNAGELRFRAVILTTVTTIAGLAPLIAERSTQAQTLIPMAVSLSFGLAAATILTLVIVPTLYLVMNDAKRAARWLRRGGAFPTPEAVEPIHGVPLDSETV